MPPSAGEVARPQSPLRAMMPQSPLRIKQGGKFYERLLTKESSGANPSFRYYGSEPSSVPFVWESEPGTPRDASRMVGGALPAITPPPSYLLRHHGGVNVSRRGTAKGRKKRYRFKRTVKVGFIADMFRKLTVGKACWWRPGPSPAQVSSSSRWLVASETVPEQEQHGRHDDQVPAAKSSAVVCSGARQMSPCWMLPFRGAGNRNRDCD